MIKRTNFSVNPFNSLVKTKAFQDGLITVYYVIYMNTAGIRPDQSRSVLPFYYTLSKINVKCYFLGGVGCCFCLSTAILSLILANMPFLSALTSIGNRLALLQASIYCSSDIRPAL